MSHSNIDEVGPCYQWNVTSDQSLITDRASVTTGLHYLLIGVLYQESNNNLNDNDILIIKVIVI